MHLPALHVAWLSESFAALLLPQIETLKRCDDCVNNVADAILHSPSSSKHQILHPPVYPPLVRSMLVSLLYRKHLPIEKDYNESKLPLPLSQIPTHTCLKPKLTLHSSMRNLTPSHSRTKIPTHLWSILLQIQIIPKTNTHIISR